MLSLVEVTVAVVVSWLGVAVVTTVFWVISAAAAAAAVVVVVVDMFVGRPNIDVVILIRVESRGTNHRRKVVKPYNILFGSVPVVVVRILLPLLRTTDKYGNTRIVLLFP